MQFLLIAKTVLSIFPMLVTAITTVEAAFPISGQGAAKLEMIKQILLGSAEVSADLQNGQFEQIWPAIQRTVSGLVGLFNATGVFQKK